MFERYLTLSVFILNCLLVSSVFAKDYDIVIMGGRVIDPETQFDDIANVGILDGRIAAISKEQLKGKDVVNASGKVVSPGFIDTHFHWQAPMGYRLGLRDGLTSSMDLELGCSGSYIDYWYKSREGVTQANYGCAVSHEFARATVIDGSVGDHLRTGPIAMLETRKKNGWSVTRPSSEQTNAILEEIDRGLQAGAPGIGSTLGYMREGVSSRELYELQKLGARYGRLTAAHTRYTLGTDTTENNGAQELIANAVVLDAPAIVLHFNNPGWRLTHELITGLQNQGHNIWGEIYPYEAGYTTLNASFLTPESWIGDLGKRYEDTVQDPVTGEFYTLESFKAAVASDPTKLIVVYKTPPEETAKWLTLKGVTMASDAAAAEPYLASWDFPLDQLGNAHPRTAGARGITIRYGREHNIPMMQLISILSYNAAKHLGDAGLKFMQERGRLQEGMAADIVVFDPERFTDNATYKNGILPSTGIDLVIVNGQIAVREDKVLPVFAGQPIRYPVESKPRFEPLSEMAWDKAFSTMIPDENHGHSLDHTPLF
jgi:hypothetical protein